MSSEVVVSSKHMTKRFGKTLVFEDVSLDVHKSEVVAIIGPSGAGKSTFIRCINHLVPFEDGTLELLGHTISGGKKAPARDVLQDIRTRVGMVFQTFNLFPHLTVMDNIILAPMEVKNTAKADAIRRAEELLDMVGLADKANMYPKRLSGGEQQRVAICRALAMDPEIMLFDEPTSALDPELVGDVLAAIQNLAKQGSTMILVTHEMTFAKEVADTVVFMADHRVVETGPARQLLENPASERAQQFLERVLRPVKASRGDLKSAVGQGGER